MEKVRARPSEPVKDPARRKARTSMTITISRLLIIGTNIHEISIYEHGAKFDLRQHEAWATVLRMIKKSSSASSLNDQKK
jgi:hypothetical protein